MSHLLRLLFCFLLIAPAVVGQSLSGPTLSGSSIPSTSVQKLSDVLSFPTISQADEGSLDAAAFLGLHDYLEEAFPLVHAQLQKQVVNSYSLLYTWSGSQPGLKPILLSAHLDVVPAEQATLAQWEQPPFAGVVQDGYVWGRGAMDDKYRVVAILEAVETLLQEGFTPARTLYLAFGHDEERGGEDGALAISRKLQEEGVTLEAVFDEGMAVAERVIPGLHEPVAFVGVASKGNFNLKLSVSGEGGHSSVPPAESPITILSTALANLQSQPFTPRMTPTTKETLRLLANQMGGKYKFAMRHYWLFKGRLLKKMTRDQATNALVRTQMAPTMLQAGEKDNVMPRVAEAVVNFRILTGESAETVMTHVREAIGDERVKVAPYGVYSPPSPVSSTSHWAYHALQRSIHDTFPTVNGIVPALFPGSTDSKHYAALTQNTYRFAPQVVDRESVKRVHNVNERLSVAVFGKCIVFYDRLIRNTCGGTPKGVALKE